jgi:uncharacterized damage-inducible protein DinB
MTIKDVERLYDYGYWANRKLMPVLDRLTPEQFTQQVAGSYGSIRNTLVHLMSAEWGWIDRCGGHKRGPALKAEDYPTLASIADTWSAVEGHVRAFLASLGDADLTRTVEFRLPQSEQAHAMRIGDLLQHSCNHAVHHRGQVALLLRSLGFVPGNFDLLFYDAERQRSNAQ